MRKWNELQKSSLYFIVTLMCLMFLTAVQVSAFDMQKPEDGKLPGHPGGTTPCQGVGKWQAGMRHHKQHRFRLALKKLNLTDDQKNVIQELRISMKKDMIKKRADLQIAQIELHGQLHKDIVDMKAVESQLKKVEGIKTSMKLNAIKTREEIKSKLTPDQQKKLVDLMENPQQSYCHLHQNG